jgi:hypothetical protein
MGKKWWRSFEALRYKSPPMVSLEYFTDLILPAAL